MIFIEILVYAFFAVGLVIVLTFGVVAVATIMGALAYPFAALAAAIKKK